MKKTILTLLILVISLFSFTGCYYTNGIDEYYFLISLGLESSSENKDLIKITVQTASSPENSSGSSESSQSSNYKIYSVDARTIDEGLTILNNYLNKEINLSHCSTLIISEELAKKGISTYISTLSNNEELRHNCDVIITSSSCFDLMNNVSKSGEAFAARLYDHLATTTEYTGFTIKSPFGKFFQSLDNDYYEPTAIYTQVSDEIVQTTRNCHFQKRFNDSSFRCI